MIQIKRAVDTALNKQYPCPSGVMGHFVGELMVRQHKRETIWTISVADVQPTDQVLEIGFGAGKAIKLLTQKTHGLVYGIDLSATMVNRARARNAQAVRSGQVMLLQGDAAQLPFKPSKTTLQAFQKLVQNTLQKFEFLPIVNL